jgi:hypothetical protein
VDFSMPDSVVPLAGFRRWVLPRPQDRIGIGDKYTLITRQHPWPFSKEGAEPIKARCRIHWNVHRECLPHTSPTARCECGVYAHHELSRSKFYRSMEFGTGSVLGGVIGWGRVYFDREWWRAEYVLPIAFVDPRDTEGHMTKEWLSRALDWLEGVSDRYQIPILPLREIEAYTLRYGAVWKVPPLTDDEEERIK